MDHVSNLAIHYLIQCKNNSTIIYSWIWQIYTGYI